jgi:membrane-bound ClpP family serine protease
MYGYDEFSIEDNSFDESYYIETTKPLLMKEGLEDGVDSLLKSDECNEQLKYKFIQCAKVNKYLTQDNNKLKKIVNNGYNEFLDLQNHTYIIYLLLFIAVIILVYQRVSIGELMHCVRILKYQHHGPVDLNAPLRPNVL